MSTIKLQELLDEDLRRWVKEKWVDQHGRPCGSSKTKGVKKCRPSKKVSKDTPKTWKAFDKKEKNALVAQKRRVGMGKRTPKAEGYLEEEAKRDACYHKVKARYKVWPSALGSLALSKCRNVGAANWGNKTKESMEHISICNECAIALMEDIKAGEMTLTEAEYRGRKVKLGKPMRGDVKKFKVYVKNPAGNVVKVNFGDPNMRIKKSNPARRRSFRARHKCATPGPRTKARYWSCRKW